MGLKLYSNLGTCWHGCKPGLLHALCIMAYKFFFSRINHIYTVKLPEFGRP